MIATLPATLDSTFSRFRQNALPAFPFHADSIPPGVLSMGDYDLRFARSCEDLHAVQTLRRGLHRSAVSESVVVHGCRT